MSLLSALRHTAEKTDTPYTEYQEEPFDLIVDNVTIARGLNHRDMTDMFKAAFKRELRGITRERDQWKEKATTLDDLLKEIHLLRGEVALLQKSMPRPNTPTPPAP